MEGCISQFRKLFLFFLFFALFASPQILSAEEPPPVPPLPLLTSVTPDQLNAEYWINRLPNPDRLIKSPEQIELFNREIVTQLPERRDIFAMSQSRAGDPIAEELELTFKRVSGRGLLDVNDTIIPRTWFDQNVRPNMAWDRVPKQISLKWGAAVRAASVRALPTHRKMIEKAGDIEFDQLQFSLIKHWTPVAILHTSSDGKWYFVQAPYVRGWVLAHDIALFDSRSRLESLVKQKDFLMVTAESVPIYNDTALLRVDERPTMGTRLPLIGRRSDSYIVKLPTRGQDGKVILRDAYVYLGEDVTQGYLPYTQRNVIKQAFKLLGERYGWGGTYNGRDCSGFTHDVFLSLGIDMPRDSRQQAFVGTQLNYFKPGKGDEIKRATLSQATPGITLLKMPLHIMLYLGEIDGEHYIIHSTWAERISMTSDLKNRINQVVVSDVTLNGNSYLGTLLSRTVSMNEIV